MAIVEVKGVSYTYPGSNEPTLNDITVSFPTKEWTTIIGHNGSGKSTLARLIDGLIPTSAGEIIVDGVPVDAEHVGDVHQKIGFVFQNPENQFVGTTVEDDVAFGLENHQVPREKMQFRIKQALNDVNMLEFAKKEPAQLSGGQKQRVAIAGILSLRPKILIFDEATSMLDPLARLNIIQLLKKLKVEKGFTIIAISHDPAEAVAGDNVVILDHGKIMASGKTTDILTNHDLMNRYNLGLPFTEQLKAKLKAKGIPVPEVYLDEEQMIQWLSQQ